MSSPFDPINANTTISYDSTTTEQAADSVTIGVILITFFLCITFVAWCARREQQLDHDVDADVPAIDVTTNSSSRRSVGSSTRRNFYLDAFLLVRSWVQDDSDGKSVTSIGTDLDCAEEGVSQALTDVCAICMMNFDEGDLICESNNSQCKHVYHKACMTSWLKKHEDCPLCREIYILDEM